MLFRDASGAVSPAMPNARPASQKWSRTLELLLKETSWSRELHLEVHDQHRSDSLVGSARARLDPSLLTSTKRRRRRRRRRRARGPRRLVALPRDSGRRRRRWRRRRLGRSCAATAAHADPGTPVPTRASLPPSPSKPMPPVTTAAAVTRPRRASSMALVVREKRRSIVSNLLDLSRRLGGRRLCLRCPQGPRPRLSLRTVAPTAAAAR